jgi:hypothetical protein
MAKAQEKSTQVKKLTEIKDKRSKDKERKSKGGDALVGRVKKVVKKSRRKLSEEKFEKQLQRTITFLEELQARITESNHVITKAEEQRKAKTNKKVRQNSSGNKHKTSAASVKHAVATTAKTVK